VVVGSVVATLAEVSVEVIQAAEAVASVVVLAAVVVSVVAAQAAQAVASTKAAVVVVSTVVVEAAPVATEDLNIRIFPVLMSSSCKD